MLLISRLRSKFKKDVQFTDIYSINSSLNTIFSMVQKASSISIDNMSNVESKSIPIPTVSKQQERITIAIRLGLPPALFNVNMLFQISGTLNFKFLKQAFTEVIARHEALRTNFVWNSQKHITLQVIHDMSQVNFDVQHQMLTSDTQLDKTLEELANYPFNIESDLLIRSYTLNSSSATFLFITLHHLVTDGWSEFNLLRELSFFYNNLIMKKEETLPALPVQYLDYTCNLHYRYSFYSSKVEKNSKRAYWKTVLSRTAPLEFPAAKNTDVHKKQYKGKHIDFSIAPNISNRVQSFCKTNNITPFILGLTAFSIMIGKTAHQDNFLIATPFPNRIPGTEDLIGFFLNLFILEARLDNGVKLIELLEHFKQNFREATANEIPFQDLIALQPNTKSYSSLVNASFVMQPYQNKLSLVNTEVVELPAPSPFAHHALVFYFDLTSCRIVFDVDILSSQTISAFVKIFSGLLDEIISAPNKTLEDISLAHYFDEDPWLQGGLTKVELNSVLHQVYNVEKSVPTHIALCYQNKSLTYRQLIQQSNLIAMQLKSLEPNLNLPIVILYERGFLPIVCSLAVMSIGGFYTCIDPENPSNRIQHILQDCGATIILSHPTLRDKHSTLFNTQHFILFDVKKLIDDTPYSASHSHFTLSEITPKMPAYCIYTSGSTGNPKGIINFHGGLKNLIEDHIDRYGLNLKTRALQQASLSFDASIVEVWPTLCVGGTVCLPDKKEIQAGPPLADFMRRLQINFTTLVPDVVEATLFCDELDFPNLLTLISAAAALSEELKAKILEKFPNIKLYVNFGHSEASVCAISTKRLTSIDKDIPGERIGTPLPGFDVCIVDQHRQPLPRGFNFTGELTLRSICGSIGKLLKPSSKQSPFIHTESSDSLFTGDCATVVDGEIFFRHRYSHHFLKIRGLRIVPQSVVNPLEKQAIIKKAWVSVCQNKKTLSQQLVAYVQVDHAKLKKIAKHLSDNAFMKVQEKRLALNNSTLAVPLPISLIRQKPVEPDELANCASDLAGRLSFLTPNSLLLLGHSNHYLLGYLLDEFANDLQQVVVIETQTDCEDHLESFKSTFPTVHFTFIYENFSTPLKTFGKYAPQSMCFDMIILGNRMVENLPSYTYLQNLISKLTKYLKNPGYLVLSAIPNLHTKKNEHNYAQRKKNITSDKSTQALCAEHTALLDERLALDPYFFNQQYFKALGFYYSDPQLKLNEGISEYSLYYLDIIAYYGDSTIPVNVIEKDKWLNWEDLPTSKSAENENTILELFDKSTDYLAIHSIPNKNYQSTTKAGLRPHAFYEFLLNQNIGFEDAFFRPSPVTPHCFDLIISHHPSQCVSIAAPSVGATYSSPKAAHVLSDHSKELKSALKTDIPRYAIPNRFIFLEDFPRLFNGKVDAKALETLGSNFIPDVSHTIKAKSPLEQTIIKIFAELLEIDDAEGISREGDAGDFFALGGTSLSVTQCASAITKAVGCTFEAKLMYDHYCCAKDIAEYLEKTYPTNLSPSLTRKFDTNRSHSTDALPPVNNDVKRDNISLTPDPINYPEQ